MTDEAASSGTRGTGGGGRPRPPVVDRVEDLTPGWFDAVLGTAGTRSAIRAVATEPVGTGQMASTVRAFLALGDGTERTVVVKYARPDLGSPLAAMAYAKEVAFYTELSDRVAVRAPDCLYAAGSGDGSRFVLVLEDLCDSVPGDQIAGCSPGQAAAALVNLAGLHGPTWCDERLAARTWLASDPSLTEDLLAPVLATAADAFEDRFGPGLDAGEAAVLATCREVLATWALSRGERFAVGHGDYRLDNLLFPRDDPARVAAVDWQTTAVTSPGRDVAFFLSTCLEVDVRRRHERDLLAAYHRALGDHDVTGYSFGDCLADYRDGLLHAPLIVLLGRLTAGVTERGDEMFRVMWRRSAAAIHDLGALDHVRARLGRGA